MQPKFEITDIVFYTNSFDNREMYQVKSRGLKDNRYIYLINNVDPNKQERIWVFEDLLILNIDIIAG